MDAEHPEAAPSGRGGSRRAERPERGRSRGCLPMVLVLVLVVAGLWFGGGWAVDRIKSLAGEEPDYAGPGSGSVTVEVHQGDSAGAIGRTLKAAGFLPVAGEPEYVEGGPGGAGLMRWPGVAAALDHRIPIPRLRRLSALSTPVPEGAA